MRRLGIGYQEIGDGDHEVVILVEGVPVVTVPIRGDVPRPRKDRINKLLAQLIAECFDVKAAVERFD